MLLKASADAGLPVSWYTYYAGGTGGPTAMKQAGLDHKVFAIGEGFGNVPDAASQGTEKAFRSKYGISIFYPRAFNEIGMLIAAMKTAGISDMTKVASALEGMKWPVFNGGEGFMRKEDHQFFQPLYIASFGTRGPNEPFDEESTSWGWRMITKLDTKDTILPTTCQMQRPST